MPPSLQMRIAKFFTALIIKNVLNEANYRRWQHEIEHRSYPQHAPLPDKFRKQFIVEEQTIDSFPLITLSPRQNQTDVHIIYMHGGVYVLPMIPQHWSIIESIINALGATVTVAIYPLAPEHTYQKTLSHLAAVYQHILKTTPHSKVVLAGDSAGGGLSLSMALDCRDREIRMPDRLILISPWIDVTLSNPEIAAVARQDIILDIPGFLVAGRWWAGDADPRHPLISPLYADLSGLPPMDVFIGTGDMLVVDARTLRDKVEQAGGVINYYEYEGAMHVFVVASFTPEAEDVYQKMSNGIRNA